MSRMKKGSKISLWTSLRRAHWSALLPPLYVFCIPVTQSAIWRPLLLCQLTGALTAQICHRSGLMASWPAVRQHRQHGLGVPSGAAVGGQFCSDGVQEPLQWQRDQYTLLKWALLSTHSSFFPSNLLCWNVPMDGWHRLTVLSQEVQEILLQQGQNVNRLAESLRKIVPRPRSRPAKVTYYNMITSY